MKVNNNKNITTEENSKYILALHELLRIVKKTDNEGYYYKLFEHVLKKYNIIN